jgi:hypothetical protein
MPTAELQGIAACEYSSGWDHAVVRPHLVARPHPVDPYATMELLATEHDPEKWMPVFGKDHAQAKG